jgi:hypothetical protein
MKHLSRFIESGNEILDNKNRYLKYVIDTQRDDLPNDVKRKIFNDASGQNTYDKYYPCDGWFKPKNKVSDESKIVYQSESDRDKENAYVYEIGDDIISDWLLSKGFTPNDEIIFLVWW